MLQTMTKRRVESKNYVISLLFLLSFLFDISFECSNRNFCCIKAATAFLWQSQPRFPRKQQGHQKYHYHKHQYQHQHQVLLHASLIPPQQQQWKQQQWKQQQQQKQQEIELVGTIGNGTFGTVHWACLGNTSDSLVVAKSAQPTTNDARAKKNAALYLDTEAYVNRRLCLGGSHSRYVAPYIGDYHKDDGSRYLLWRASGNYTLQHYINMKDCCPIYALSKALGITATTTTTSTTASSVHNLGRELLSQLLSALAFCHSLGIVHRDIKPANILVDAEAQCIRLIDFGSAADMGSWGVVQRGYRGAEKGPRSILYCAPEEFIDEEYPYSFDIYSAAICWLRILVPGLRRSEDHLWDFRIAVRDKKHDLLNWEEAATLTAATPTTPPTPTTPSPPSVKHGSDTIKDTDESSLAQLPEGWEELFSCQDGINCWRLLVEMLQYKAKKRPSASEALLSKYLNPHCNEVVRPLPPAKPWSLPSHLERIAKETHMYEDVVETCEVSDFYIQTVTVDLELTTTRTTILSQQQRHQKQLYYTVSSLGLLLKEATTTTTIEKNDDAEEQYNYYTSTEEENCQVGGVGAIVVGFAKGGPAECSGFINIHDKLLSIGPIDVENATFKHILEILSHWQRPTVSLQFIRDI